MKLKVFLKGFLLLSCLSVQLILTVCAEDKSQWLKNEPITPIPNVTGLDAKKIALGKRLFHDANLSADGTISCANCHALTNDGINGQKGNRNAPTVLNSSLLYRQFWDARVATLEEQISGSLTNPVEMAGNWDDTLGYIQSNNTYRKAFSESYAGVITKQTVSHAIAEFERSLLTPNGPFDRYLKGDSDAIDMPTKRGV